MSEYQSYEFRAIDQPLSQDAMAHLRRLSTRARITPTSFSNVYHWGDFKGDPPTLVEAYFDIFVYFANWGTRWCILRLPLGLLDPDQVNRYSGDTLTSWTTETHLVLQFLVESEGAWEWVEEDDEGWIDQLAGLREELRRGDLRPLFIGWLADVGWQVGGGVEASPDEAGWVEEEEEWDEEGEGADDEDDPGTSSVPPVPPGMGSLTAAQKTLASFLYLDDDLLTAAARHSTGDAPAGPSDEDLKAWLATVPAERKDGWLLRVLAGGSAPAGEMLAEFRRHVPTAGLVGDPALTVADLVAEAGAAREERERKERQAAERRRREAERRAAEAREKHLHSLLGKDEELWRQVEQNTDLKNAKGYDAALSLLLDLQELARRDSRLSAFELRVMDYRERHARKPSMIKRLDEAGL